MSTITCNQAPDNSKTSGRSYESISLACPLVCAFSLLHRAASQGVMCRRPTARNHDLQPETVQPSPLSHRSVGAEGLGPRPQRSSILARWNKSAGSSPTRNLGRIYQSSTQLTSAHMQQNMTAEGQQMGRLYAGWKEDDPDLAEGDPSSVWPVPVVMARSMTGPSLPRAPRSTKAFNGNLSSLRRSLLWLGSISNGLEQIVPQVSSLSRSRSYCERPNGDQTLGVSHGEHLA